MTTYVGNICQKIENMILDAKDKKTVQPRTPVSVAGISKKSCRVSKKITSKADAKRSTKDSSINCDFGYSIKANIFISCVRPHVESADIKPSVGSDENQQNRKMPASKIATEVTSSKTDTRSSEHSREVSNANQIHDANVSKTDSAEVKTFASVADCCNEIGKAITEQNHSVPVLVEPDEEKNTSSFSSDIFGFSMVNGMQPKDCSHSTIIVSHPDRIISSSMARKVANEIHLNPASNVIADIDATIEQDHKTTRQDGVLKLEETCVIITKDELQLVHKKTFNVKTSEKKWLQPFSLSKKSTRKQELITKKKTSKQEYKELAIRHRNDENGKGDDCVESLCPTLKEDVSEHEWEFL